MKKLIISVLLLVGFGVYASDMPSYMKDGKITVTLKDGRKYEFSTNEYMVVKREGPKDVVIEVDGEGKRTVHQSPAIVVGGPNTVKAFGGAGPSGIKVTTGPTSVTIEQDYGAIYGLGYSRQLNKRWSLEAVGLSNKTGLLGLGYSF